MGNQPQKINKATDCFKVSQYLIDQFKDHMCNYLRVSGCQACTLEKCTKECKERLDEVKKVVERDFETALDWFVEHPEKAEQGDYPENIQNILNRYSVLSIYLPNCLKDPRGDPREITIEPCLKF